MIAYFIINMYNGRKWLSTKGDHITNVNTSNVNVSSKMHLFQNKMNEQIN